MRRFAFAFMLILIALPVFSQGTSHLVTVRVHSSGGGYPENECITFEAYILSRPGEILTQDDVGCTYSDSLVVVNTGNFPTPWSVGDTLVIDISDTCTGEEGTVSGELTSDVMQELDEVTLEPAETTSITVLFPNGGELLYFDETQLIEWESVGEVDSVGIVLSTDGGSSWSTVIESCPNTGGFVWTVPSVPTRAGLVKIFDIADTTVFDVSDSFFTIVEFDTVPPAAITDLVAECTSETTANITWTAVGDDSTHGMMSGFIIKYAYYPITESNWEELPFADTANVCFIPGTVIDTCVSGLYPGMTFYFAVRTFDEAGNLAPLSNIASCTTPAAPDTVPPARILIHLEDYSSDRIQISWYSTGDDGWVGTASEYDIRYSTEYITEDNFIFAEHIDDPPEVLPAGSFQRYTIEGLTPGEEYWVALRVRDDAYNWSKISNVVGARLETADTTPPGRIDDLSIVDESTDGIIIGWSAPGDDDFMGQAESYEIRYSTGYITEDNWDDAIPVPDPPMPLSAYTYQEDTIYGLAEGYVYYFGIKATDDEGNISALSNIVEGATIGRIGHLPDTTVCEDTPPFVLCDLEDVFYPAGVEYFVSDDQPAVHPYIEGHYLWVSVDENYNGTSHIVAWFVWGAHTFADTMTLVVEPVNDAPEFVTFPRDTIAVQGLLFLYDADAVDPDGDGIRYSLIVAPTGMTIDSATGAVNWTPGSELEGIIPVRIVATDGVDETVQEFNLVVYKFTSRIFAPGSLSAEGGFNNSVPLTWELPEIFSLYSKRDLVLSGYIVYRSELYYGPYSVICTTATTYFNDISAGNDTTYYYKVRAIYSSPAFVSAYSPIASATPLASEFICVDYDEGYAPEIDGVLSERDLAECTEVVVEPTLSLFFKHNGIYLYLAVRSTLPVLETKFFFDDDYSRSWDASTESDEGYYFFGFDGEDVNLLFRSIGMPDGLWMGDPVPTGNVLAEVTYSDGEFVLEARLGMNDPNEFECGFGDSVGVAFTFLRTGLPETRWPYDVEPLEPEGFGTLVLFGAPGSFFVYPLSFSATLEEGYTTNRVLHIDNLGAGPVNWWLFEDASWLVPGVESGTIPSFGHQDIQLTFSAELLDVGVYTEDIFITTTDPTLPEISVACTLTVTYPSPSRFLWLTPPAATFGHQGEYVDVPIVLGELYDNEIYSIRFTVWSNPDVIRPISVERGEVYPSDWSDPVAELVTSDAIIVNLSGVTPFASSGEIVRVRYFVRETAPEGASSPVQIRSIEYNRGEEPAPMPMTRDGTFIVGDYGELTWGVRLEVWTSDGTFVKELTFGTAGGASDGFDTGLDRESLPVMPGLANAFFLSPVDAMPLSRDIRSEADTIIVWNIVAAGGSGVLRWDPVDVPAFTFINGEFDMQVISEFAFSVGDTIEIAYQRAPEMEWTVTLSRGWNLVSSPIVVGTGGVRDYFPTVVGDAYWYDPAERRYLPRRSIEPGKGYFVLALEDTTYTLTGYPVTSFTLTLDEGWNMVGAPASDYPFAAVDERPEGAIIDGSLFWYDAERGTYVNSDFLYPGRGFWVCTFEPCTASVIGSDLSKPEARGYDVTELIRFVFSFGELSVALSDEATDGFDEGLDIPCPPEPPNSLQEAFIESDFLPLVRDVRAFGEKRWRIHVLLDEDETVGLEKVADYPITILVDGEETANQRSIPLARGEHTIVVILLPFEKFALLGSSPNPFNAETHLSFLLEGNQEASLEIYNIKGEKIREFKITPDSPGRYDVVWDGRDKEGVCVSTGTYLVRLRQGENETTGKCLLLK